MRTNIQILPVICNKQASDHSIELINRLQHARHEHQNCCSVCLRETTSAPPPASDARPLLFIHVPDSPPADRVLPTPAPSPTLTVTLKLRHAITRDDAARRRKMAKLSRTLGVNVPTELVFPPENTNDRRYRRLTTRTVKTDRTSRIESKRRSGASASRSGLTPSDSDPISHGWVWVGKRDEIPPDVRERIQRSRVDSGLPFDWVSVGRLGELPEEDQTVDTVRGMRRKEMGWSVLMEFLRIPMCLRSTANAHRHRASHVASYSNLESLVFLVAAHVYWFEPVLVWSEPSRFACSEPFSSSPPDDSWWNVEYIRVSVGFGPVCRRAQQVFST
ncbi:hypothetical protein B0H13DRAFT_2338861 [Mycena leptocephala]|nr:hypothetical protein B0H13DRAFT_2338861 [Mycena leptocephala]